MKNAVPGLLASPVAAADGSAPLADTPVVDQPAVHGFEYSTGARRASDSPSLMAAFSNSKDLMRRNMVNTVQVLRERDSPRALQHVDRENPAGEPEEAFGTSHLSPMLMRRAGTLRPLEHGFDRDFMR